MARFLIFGYLLLSLVGCSKPFNPASENTADKKLPVELPARGSLPEGLIDVTPVTGMNIPMPAHQFESSGAKDELERIILTDFKKDFTLYKIYEFPTDSSKPEILYVFTKRKDGPFQTDLGGGATMTLGPSINSYDGLAHKLSGSHKFFNATRRDAELKWADRVISNYHGSLVADYVLSWSVFIDQTNDGISEIIFLERSKGPFENKLWRDGVDIWWNEILAKWQNSH